MIKNIEIFLKKLKEFGLKNDIPNVTETNARFLKDLILIKKPKKILEIWTANWYSTIQMWTVAEKLWTKITGIEFSSVSYDMAINNVKEVGLENTINIIQGNALEIIPTLEEKYDFVFIDWMKKSYKEFLTLVWDKIEDEGVIVLDDVIKFEYKMPDLYEYLEEKGITYNRIPIDIDDGIIMIIKN